MPTGAPDRMGIVCVTSANLSEHRLCEGLQPFLQPCLQLMTFTVVSALSLALYGILVARGGFWRARTTPCFLALDSVCRTRLARRRGHLAGLARRWRHPLSPDFLLLALRFRLKGGTGMKDVAPKPLIAARRHSPFWTSVWGSRLPEKGIFPQLAHWKPHYRA